MSGPDRMMARRRGDAEAFAVLGWGVSLLTAAVAQRLFDPLGLGLGLGPSPGLAAWRLATTATGLVAVAWTGWVTILAVRRLVAGFGGEVAGR